MASYEPYCHGCFGPSLEHASFCSRYGVDFGSPFRPRNWELGPNSLSNLFNFSEEYYQAPPNGSSTPNAVSDGDSTVNEAVFDKEFPPFPAGVDNAKGSTISETSDTMDPTASSGANRGTDRESIPESQNAADVPMNNRGTSIAPKSNKPTRLDILQDTGRNKGVAKSPLTSQLPNNTVPHSTNDPTLHTARRTVCVRELQSIQADLPLAVTELEGINSGLSRRARTGRSNSRRSSGIYKGSNFEWVLRPEEDEYRHRFAKELQFLPPKRRCAGRRSL